MAMTDTMTLKQAEQLRSKGHVVAIYPRKKQVVVDGFKYYRLTGQTKNSARRKKPKSNPAWPQRWVLRLTKKTGEVLYYRGMQQFSSDASHAIEYATGTSAIAAVIDLRRRFELPAKSVLEHVKAELLLGRRQNPSSRQRGKWVIFALGPLKERLYYTGRGFGQWTRDPSQAHWLIGRDMAEYVAYHLQAVDPVVAGWKVTVRRMFKTISGAKKNPVPPSSKARLKEAARRFEDFTGHAPEHIDVIDVPDIDTAFGIGHCDGVLYSCVRDGNLEHYIHKFKNKARPYLASSFDGQQLLLLGGGFQFTERGIVDD